MAPTTLTPPEPQTDQERFDAAVIRDEKVVLRVLAGVAVIAALAMSTIALLVSTGRHDTTTTVTVPAATAVVPSAPAVSVTVAGENKKGPDGKLHDSFSKTNFAVKVGVPTRLRIDNKDDVMHSITSTAAGVEIMVQPGVHTYTLVATKAGHFRWLCTIPCDSPAKGWAMTHAGYMAGYITAS